MNKDDFISEEQLNAFVDDELDAEERSRIFGAAESDPELDRRLCRQQRLQELVKHAYGTVPAPDRGGARTGRRGRLARALVASALILVGLGTGLLTHRLLDGGRAAEAAGAVAAAESPNFLLHVVHGTPDDLRQALNTARELLAAGDAAHPRRVEVVANEQGLNLLRTDITPYAAEIQALAESDVVFYACSRAIQRLEERGVTVQLVPQANPRYTALDRVVLRLQDGWNYIKL